PEIERAYRAGLLEGAVGRGHADRFGAIVGPTVDGGAIASCGAHVAEGRRSTELAHRAPVDSGIRQRSLAAALLLFRSLLRRGDPATPGMRTRGGPFRVSIAIDTQRDECARIAVRRSPNI